MMISILMMMTLIKEEEEGKLLSVRFSIRGSLNKNQEKRRYDTEFSSVVMRDCKQVK